MEHPLFNACMQCRLSRGGKTQTNARDAPAGTPSSTPARLQGRLSRGGTTHTNRGRQEMYTPGGKLLCNACMQSRLSQGEATYTMQWGEARDVLQVEHPPQRLHAEPPFLRGTTHPNGEEARDVLQVEHSLQRLHTEPPFSRGGNSLLWGGRGGGGDQHVKKRRSNV